MFQHSEYSEYSEYPEYPECSRIRSRLNPRAVEFKSELEMKPRFESINPIEFIPLSPLSTLLSAPTIPSPTSSSSHSSSSSSSNSDSDSDTSVGESSSANGTTTTTTTTSATSTVMLAIIEELLREFIFGCDRLMTMKKDEDAMHQLELAHWKFCDDHCDRNPALNKLSFRDFIIQMMVCSKRLESSTSETLVPFLIPLKWSDFCRDYGSVDEKSSKVKKPSTSITATVEKLCGRYNDYKNGLPSCGACIIDRDLTHVIIVQSWNTNSWNFPKGKKDREETDLACAVRETLEETGFNIGPHVKEEIFIEDISLVAASKKRKRKRAANAASGLGKIEKKSNSNGNNGNTANQWRSFRTSPLQSKVREEKTKWQRPSEFTIRPASRSPPSTLQFEGSDVVKSEKADKSEKREKRIKLFVVTDVDRNSAVFKTQTQKEIRAIRWIPIADIPFIIQRPSKLNRHLWALTKFEHRLRNFVRQLRAERERDYQYRREHDNQYYPSYNKIL